MSARHLRARRLAKPPALDRLPGRLPDGERLLWQGAPSTGALLRRAFHLRLVAAYFATILALSAASGVSGGASAHAVGLALLHRAMLAAVPFALIALYAWAIRRSTTYSITTHRVVFSFGIALPMTFNIPFARVAGAELRLYPGGAGDIPLCLLPGEKLSYFVMWPHARPWRMAAAQPMLRCVPDAEAASMILAQALTEHARACPAVAQQAVRLLPMRQGSAGVQGQPVAV